MSANSDLWALRDAIEHELDPAPEKEFVTTPYHHGHEARHGSDKPKQATTRRDYWRQWLRDAKERTA